MVALLPTDPERPARAWVALGSPCVSVYVPVPVPAASTASTASSSPPLPATVGDARVWTRFAALRDAVGSDAGALTTVRAELSVLEDALWDEADGLGTDPGGWESFGTRATTAVAGALDTLAAAGLGAADGASEGDR